MPLPLEVQALIPTLGSMPIPAMITDGNGVVCWVNAESVRLMGYAAEELVCRNAAILEVDKDDAPHQLRELAQNVTASGEPWKGEFTWRHRNGELHFSELTITPVRDHDHFVSHSLCTFHDITKRKRAEEALRQSEAQIRVKLDSLLSPEEELGSLELADIIDVPAVQALMDDFNKLTDLLVAVLDLRGRVLVATGWQDVCTKFHRVNPETCRNCIESDTMLSLNVEPGSFKAFLCKNNMWDVVTPITVGGVHVGNLFTGQFFFEDMEPNLDVFRAQAQQHGFDETGYLAAVEKAPRFKRERVAAAMSFFTKLAQMISTLSHSNLKLAKSSKALTESNERYRSILNASPDAIVIADLDGRMAIASPSAIAMFGLDRHEGYLGRSIGDLVAPEDRERALSDLTRKLEGLIGGPTEYHGLRSDGSTFDAEVNTEFIRDLEKRPTSVVIVIRDITDRRLLEAKFQQAQKMESVGRLAGGVAHDFNNLLTVINGFSQMLLAKLTVNDPRRNGLEEILKAGERAAGLTGQLLAFSRKQLLEPRKLDLNRVVLEMRTMLQRLMGEDVQVRVALNAHAGVVCADPHQLDQVVMNLAVNARDAMPDGGQLLIETSNVELDVSYTQAHPDVHVGRYVLLAVSDTGVGIDQGTQRNIFEPFFTTKGLGKGTGLGLSMVHGIVHQSGGHISVESELGRGTTFRIYLPRLDDVVEAPGTPPAASALGGNETVLVAEDQDEVRNYVVTVLRTYGYRVIPANSAGAAMTFINQAGGHIDLLVTDVVMPNGSGADLAHELERRKPGTKVLFMSGYTDDAIAHHGVLEEGAEFIQKPFSPKQLAAKIRSVLG